MQSRRLKVGAALACIAMAMTGAVAAAQPALFEVGNLVLRADGGFEPRALPKQHFAPIDFAGWVTMATKDGGPPPPIQQAVVDFDKEGRLTVAGLPTCPVERVANASTAEARRLCPGAIVGRGHFTASVALPGGAITIGSPLTLFNGVREDGNPTVIVHAQTTVPTVQTYAPVVPIERRRGGFRYRATFNIPPIAGGLGAVTQVNVRIGRHWTTGGKTRSYAAARCRTGVLRTHGRLTFADGTVIDGSVEKPCTPK